MNEKRSHAWKVAHVKDKQLTHSSREHKKEKQLTWKENSQNMKKTVPDSHETPSIECSLKRVND